MKKKLVALILTTAMCLVTLAGCGGSSGSTDTTTNSGGAAAGGGDTGVITNSYNWKLAHEENDGEYEDIFADYFAQVLNERSGGKINLQVYTVGQLGDSSDLFEMNTNGTVEFGISNPGATMPIIPEAGVFSLHFLFPETLDKFDALTDGDSEGFKLMNDLYANQNVHVLKWEAEAGNVWTANKAIEKPEDFKGVKFRTMASSVISESYNAYGANAVSIPYTEVYSALQLGMADGQVNPAQAIVGSSFTEVQDYAMLAYPDSFIYTVHANQTFWDSLSAEEQQFVDECIAEASKLYRADRNVSNEEFIKTIGESCTIIEYTEDMIKPFREIAEANRDKIFTKEVGAGGQAVLDAFVSDISKL